LESCPNFLGNQPVKKYCEACIYRGYPLGMVGLRRQAHLDKQIVAVTTLMRVAEDKQVFAKLFKTTFPESGQQLDVASPSRGK
jgi:hypothetical protein